MVGSVPVEPNENDPRELILKAKAGDIDAFERLYALYYNPVFRYLYLRVREKGAAEDITQAVFVKVYNSLQRFELGETNPLSYFFTIARTTLIDHYRKEKNSPVYDDTLVAAHADKEHDPNDYAGREEVKDLIISSLDILTEDQKEIIALKFFEDLSNKEISDLTGKKEEAIRQLQLRALRKLRDHFKKENLI